MTKLWFNNKKAAPKKDTRKPLGKEISDNLLAQISGGLADDASDCHVAN